MMSPITHRPFVAGAASPMAGQPAHDFWQSPTVQNVLPFLTSLSLHAVIICIGLVTYKAISIVTATAAEEQKFIPYSPIISDTIVADGILNFGQRSDPLTKAIQDNAFEQSTANAFAEHMRSSRIASDAGGSEGKEIEAVIGVGFAPGGKGNALGHHQGPDSGEDDGQGGALALLGNPRGGAKGIKGTGLFPDIIGAHRIAYVCDASGSMLPKMEPLKVELTKAIMRLKVIQGFNVIFFRDELKPQSFMSSLVAASPQTKARALKFLGEVDAGSSTNPIPGLELAFKQQPELIFLLTDGDFEDNGVVLARIRQLNKNHKVRINTIAFVGPADTDVKFRELLRTIATENGGDYKCVSPDDL